MLADKATLFTQMAYAGINSCNRWLYCKQRIMAMSFGEEMAGRLQPPRKWRER